jgi:hypothetical protein
MLYKFLPTLILSILFVCTSCTSKLSNDCKNPNSDNLKEMVSKNPEHEALLNFKQNKIYFLEVQNYSSEIPGISWKDPKIKTYGYKLIEGTGDNFCDSEDYQLQIKIRNYAEIFNKTMASLIDKKQ